ncbi:DUF4360 domain-containing protein [Oligoflexus tunisiensis]|uniref:DUF4360 domain-containing protein n=1 Tax=Oligoflexus tunisiensis TaxID=708132 RepID=UPI00114CC696|nr:DUF4360 domain-containing protein [Oligoflexus tunisiensis]
MQHKLKTFGLGLLLAGMMTPALAQDDAPHSFRINNIRSNGTGCPIGTVAVNISDDQQAFTLSFSEFYAEVSPSLGIQNQRKTCRVVFDTEQDAGWEYAIFAVTYRGFAGLDAGVRGEQDLRFGGVGKQARSTMTLVGPYEDDYINSQEVPISSLKWSGCKSNKQKDFTIDAALTLQAPDEDTQGLFTVDTVDGEIRQEYEVLWRECKGGKKAFAVCRLSVPGKDGTHQLISKHPGKNPNQALNKARSKLAKKCQKAKGSAPNCDADKAQCSIINL